MAYQAAVHETTRKTPNYMMPGKIIANAHSSIGVYSRNRREEEEHTPICTNIGEEPTRRACMGLRTFRQTAEAPEETL